MENQGVSVSQIEATIEIVKDGIGVFNRANVKGNDVVGAARFILWLTDFKKSLEENLKLLKNPMKIPMKVVVADPKVEVKS